MKLSNHRSRLKKITTKDGYQMAYVDEGKGPAIMLLHGVPTSSYLYRKIIPLLSEQGRRVIVPDMLGYGNSDKPKGYEIYSGESQAKRLVELTDSLHIDQWSHVCHDMGGMVTWELMRDFSDRISSLALLNTIIYPEGFCPPIRMKKNLLTRWYTRLYCSNLLGRKIMDSTFKNGLSKTYALTAEELDAYTIPMLEGSGDALYYFFAQTGIPLPDYSHVLKKIKLPARVIWGLKDDILVWEKQASMVMTDLNLSKSDITVIPECKHFIQEEHPALIAEVLLSLS